jgi:hypothetical protein
LVFNQATTNFDLAIMHTGKGVGTRVHPTLMVD